MIKPVRQQKSTVRLESETNKAAAVWKNHTHEIVKHPSPVGQLLKQEFGKLSRL